MLVKRPPPNKNRKGVWLLFCFLGSASSLWAIMVAVVYTKTAAKNTTTVTKSAVSSDASTEIIHASSKKELALLQTSERVLYYEDGAPPVIGIHAMVPSEDQTRTTEIVYALPETNSANEDIHGIALLLHGCSHNALKFFSPSALCETCIGLSEELRISRILLQQQTLAVMAVTSKNRKNGCWSNQDVLPVQDSLKYIMNIIQQKQPQQTTHTEQLPVLAFGASSGGSFAAQLAVQRIAQAAMVGVMSLGDALATKWKHLDDTKKPPIYLAPMPNDQRTTKGTMRDYELMKGAFAEDGNNPVILDVDTCASMPVTASFLNECVPHMTVDMAEMIMSALVKSGHVDMNDGFLKKDPTKSDWRPILQNECGNEDCLNQQPLGPGISPLAKALHRAWAFHEYCSEVTLKALAFFQRELGGPAFLKNP